ncbi:MAG: hypothetical protein WCH34_00150 [Bacteroidota bacterium]
MIKKLIYKIKKNPFQYFLLKLLVFIAIVFVIDFAVGNVLRYLYFKQESGLLYRTTYSIEKTTADVLVFGSSRANHHYHPEVLEKRLHLSYYNVGRDGNFMFYHYAVLKGILKRYSPKLIILDFVKGEFKPSQESYDRLSSLLPYYHSHPEMRSIIELKSKYEWLKLVSSIYPYNSSIFTIAAGNAEFNKTRKGDIQGYVPLSKTWNGPLQIDSSSTNKEIDSNKVNMYASFIKDCISSKVKLIVVCSPYYHKSLHPDYSLTLGQEIARKYNVPFFDYSSDSMFVNNVKYFADINHLNDGGAMVFSNILVDKISKTND